jgi:putative ABC transport system permease protein
MRIAQEARLSLRILLAKPGFTAVAALTLALGIGANAAIFSVIYTVLLKSLPYRDADHIVVVWQNNLKKGIPKWNVPYPDFVYWRENARSFDQVAAFREDSAILSGDGNAEHIPTAIISSNFFSLLGAKPELGREILPEEDRPGGPHVVMISHNLWKRHYKSDPQIIGKSILLDGTPYSVVGVMAPGFKFFHEMDAWVSLGFFANQGWARNRLSHPLTVIAHLKPGVSMRHGQAEMSKIAADLARLYPDTNKDYLVNVVSLRDELVGDIRPGILLLFGGVALVLLITCANVANLLLSRAVARQKEMALRTALGASRMHLVLQLLTESVMLGILGGVPAVLFGWIGTRLLVSLAPVSIPYVREAALNLPMLTFIFALSLICGVLCGVLPVFSIPGFNLNDTLKNESHASTGGGLRGTRLRKLLAVSEIALTVTLLISTGLMLRSFVRLQRLDPGFNPGHRLVVKLDFPDPPYKTGEQIDQFTIQLRSRLQGLPGVASAAFVSMVPLTGETNLGSIIPEGSPDLSMAQAPAVEFRSATPNYFKTMGMQLLQGRDFTDADTLQSPKVAIVNEAMARKFWPGQTVIGKHVTVMSHRHEREIVGLVGNIRNVHLDSDPVPEMYLPMAQGGPPFTWLVVHTTGSASDLIPTVQAQIGEVDKNVPQYKASTLDDLLSESLGRRRFNLLLLLIFAISALVLASVGLYGVVSYGVNQRVQEIGIRIALGGQRSHVLGLILKSGIGLAGVGIGLGIILALFISRLIANFVFGIGSKDFLTYAGASLVLFTVALAASYFPARRATRVDPVKALRQA